MCKAFGWFVILVVAGFPIWSIVMNRLYIWIGVPVSALWLWGCWFFLFPFGPPRHAGNDDVPEHGRLVINSSTDVEEEERNEKEHEVIAGRSGASRVRELLSLVLLSGFNRGRKRPILFSFGFIVFLVLIICLAVGWEDLCISEYPFERTPPSSLIFATTNAGSCCSSFSPSLSLFPFCSLHKVVATLRIPHVPWKGTMSCLSQARREGRLFDIRSFPLSCRGI